MLPDIGHFIIVLVYASLAKSIPEKWFMRPWSACCNNHAIKPLILDRFRYLFCRISGTCKQGFLSVCDVRQILRIVNHSRYIYNSSNVCSTVTNKYPYLRFFFRCISFLGILSFLCQLVPAIVKKLTALGACTAGRHNRFWNIHRPLKSATYENTRSGGLNGIDRIDPAEAMLV